MNLNKAREILELNIKEAGKHMPPDVKIALELAVEAFRRFQVQRQTPECHGFWRLPGESNDNGGH